MPSPLLPFLSFTAAYFAAARALTLWLQSPSYRFALPLVAAGGITVANIVLAIGCAVGASYCFREDRKNLRDECNGDGADATDAQPSEHATSSAASDTSESTTGALQPKDSLWTIHNKRYDLSSFIKVHPGGETALLLGRGRNCTVLFESYHSLTYSGTAGVAAKLKQFYVEDAVEGDDDFDTSGWKWSEDDAPFYTDLVYYVRRHFWLPVRARGAGVGKQTAPSETAISRDEARTVTKATFLKWMYAGSGFVGAIACLVGAVFGDWVSIFLLPAFYWIGPSSMMHDGCHFALSASPTVNRIFSYIGSAHMSPTSWNQQHTVAHHSYTNEAGKDPDLYHFSMWSRNIDPKSDKASHMSTAAATPGFRTSLETSPVRTKSCGCLSRRQFWRMGLARIFLSTVGPSYIWDLLSFTLFPNAFLGISKYDPLMTTRRRMLHFAGRAVVISICCVLPLAGCALHVLFVQAAASQQGLEVSPAVKSLALLKGVAFAFIPYLVHGGIFYVFSQVSHIQHECFDAQPQQPQREKHFVSTANDEESNKRLSSTSRCSSNTDKLKTDWAVAQVTHTADYSCSSDLWLWLSNGLNHQTAHHLFPGVDWCHHQDITRIVVAVAKKHGITFVQYPSFLGALRSHFRHLVEVNDSGFFGEKGREFVRQHPGIARALCEEDTVQ